MNRARLLGILIAFSVAGCAKEHIPTYPPMPAPTAMELIAARAKSIRTVSAQALVTLTKSSGATVRLDAAIAMQPPDRARLRAWIFGQAVFDMTLTPDGLWLISPQQGERRQQILAAGGNAGNLTRQWMQLMIGTFDITTASIDETGADWIVTQPRPDGTILTCTIDRRTVTPRRYMLKDAAGKERFTLTLSRYVEVGGVVWPTRIDATSESGRVTIELRDLEINAELPAGAFKPPVRAEKLP